MKKYIPIMIASFIWIWPAILIKMLSFHFDDYTQNFYRYLAGSSILIIINLIYHKKEFLNSLKRIPKFILPTILIFMHQITWVAGIRMLTPTVAVLIGKSTVLFTILFSFIFFSDERRIIKSKLFMLGSSLAIIGVCGIIIGKGNSHLNSFNLGAVLILTGSLFWTLYTITAKPIVEKTDPFVSAGIVFTLSLPLFFICTLLFGDIKALYVAPKSIIFILFLSGIFCVGIGNALNYKSIKLIGTTITSNLILVTPLFTAIFSYIIFKEVLTPYQILAGIILLIGCYILMSAGNRLLTNR
ncbi:MAG: DMT family transporter [Candidatus Aerophobetes bacterium]|nr:DMT family transporter [Candidatus Aerophobetes bacterium]